MHKFKTLKKANLIVAIDRNFGIGINNVLPWNLITDMNRFAKLTRSNVSSHTKNHVIMGKNTFLSIPDECRPLSGRKSIVVSSTLNQEYYDKNNVIIVKSLEDAMAEPQHDHASKWIIGGEEIYKQALSDKIVDKVSLTYINNSYDCDTFFPVHMLSDFGISCIEPPIKDISTGVNYLFMTLNSDTNTIFQLRDIIPEMKNNETGYLILLEKLVKMADRDEWRETRNGTTVSTFSNKLQFDLSRGFPLLTTKKMYWKGIVEELLFFLKGDTNALNLSDKDVHIWKENTTKEFIESRKLHYNEGDMGPMYGFQWRHFGAEYTGFDTDYSGKGFDQLLDLLTNLRTDPTSRRLMITTYNPSDVSKSVLAPCHSLVLQFYVENEQLSVCMYQRSADIFLGVPFNIASTALLTNLLAYLLGYDPGSMSIVFGDLHLYKEHIEAAKIQLTRVPKSLPRLNIVKNIDFDMCIDKSTNNAINFLETLTLSDLELINYKSDPLIKAQMKA